MQCLFSCYFSHPRLLVDVDIQILMGSLVYLRHGIENSPYRSLLETNQWAEICNIFTRDACALLGLSVESPLSVRSENTEQHARYIHNFFSIFTFMPNLKSGARINGAIALSSPGVCLKRCNYTENVSMMPCLFPQFCIRLYGLASADEHQAGDRTETV